MPTEELPGRDTEGQSASKPERKVAAVGATVVEQHVSTADLSSEIVKMLPHTAQQRVTCRQIAGNRYRCNWWTPQGTDKHDNPDMYGLTVTTHRVTKSEILRVTKTDKGIVIG